MRSSPALLQRLLKLRLSSVDRDRAARRSNTVDVIAGRSARLSRLPPVASSFLLGSLLHSAYFHAVRRFRQRQNVAGLVIVRFGALLVNELPLDALELPAYVEFACSCVNPGARESEHFAFTEPKDERKNVSGIERVAVAAGRLQEPTRFLYVPR